MFAKFANEEELGNGDIFLWKCILKELVMLSRLHTFMDFKKYNGSSSDTMFFGGVEQKSKLSSSKPNFLYKPYFQESQNLCT